MKTWADKRTRPTIRITPTDLVGHAWPRGQNCLSTMPARSVGVSALSRLRKPLMQTHRSGGIVEMRPCHNIRGLSSLIPATAQQTPRCEGKTDSRLGSRLRPSVSGRISWVTHDLGYPVRVLIREGICGLSTANNDSGRTLNHNAGGGKRHCGRTIKRERNLPIQKQIGGIK